MPITSMVHITARRATPGAAFGAGPTRPTAQKLLDTIGMYIPTDVTALYIPIAAGLVAAEASGETKRAVAIGVGLLAAFSTWVLAHKTARKAAQDAGQAPPSAVQTLKAGWYEIAAALIAFLIWSWAMPGSWHDVGKSQLWLPALVVGGASVIIGGIATLLDRDEG